LSDVAATDGSKFLSWFHAVMLHIPEVAAAARQARDRLLP
jgi:hypothetical protein